MFEVIFLGTSASAPSVYRGLSAQIVIHNEHRFLVDCGEGTQRQILKSGLGFKRLNKILITHSHLDHILGLGGLLSTLMRWEAMEEMEIFAGRWAMRRIYDLLHGVVLRGAQPPVPLHLREIEPGILFQDDDFTVSAFPVDHRSADCYGFLFEEKTRRPFLPEKAEALDVPPGPWRRDLVLGQAVSLPDGRAIEPDQVLGPPRPGTRFVHIGDVGRTDNLNDICRDADALAIESTYLDDEAELADTFAHMTARRVAEFAQNAGVKHLLLTHISRRYRERDVIEEARSVFPNSYVVRDFDHFQVKRGECVKVEGES
ncbi:MAG TPA: ribonuclease Z [Anaerolineales bacterium]|nr:ribonuclease Z [Anaerolineales bacterium]